MARRSIQERKRELEEKIAKKQEEATKLNRRRQQLINREKAKERTRENHAKYILMGVILRWAREDERWLRQIEKAAGQVGKKERDQQDAQWFVERLRNRFEEEHPENPT